MSMKVCTVTSAALMRRSDPPAEVSVGARRYNSSYPATSPVVSKIGCRARQMPVTAELPVVEPPRFPVAVGAGFESLTRAGLTAPRPRHGLHPEHWRKLVSPPAVR